MKRITAFTAAMSMVAGSILLTAGPAAAVNPTVSQSRGQFLSGSVGTTPLADVVALLPASAVNDGTTATVTDNHPLSATVLNAIQADLGGGLNLFGSNGVITLGAVNQYASASSDGSSKSATGAVDNNGAIAVGGQDGVPAADATVDLGKVLGSSAGPGLSVISAGTLQVGAVSATANQTAAGVQSGTYKIADLNLNLTSPLITNLTSSLKTANLQALLGGLGDLSNVPNLADTLANFGPVTSLDGSIVVNISTGQVSIDVVKVLTAAGLDLNNLPPNKEIVPLIVSALTTQLVPTLTKAVNQLVAQVTAQINAIIIKVPIIGTVLPTGPLVAPLLPAITGPLTAPLTTLGSTVATPLGDALTNVLSLIVNGQQTTTGKFTETALRVTLVPGTPALATVNLASASVGANAPLAKPTTLSLDPDHGPVTGGTSVAITGAGFVPGGTSVTIGGNVVAAANVTVTAGGTIATFNTPAHAQGPVGVTVTTGGGTSSPALSFTYDPGPPTGLSLTPNHGPAAGGTSVTVTGTNFVQGTTTVLIGDNTVPANLVTVANNGTTATFTTPAHNPGPVKVTLTTGFGTTTPPLDYTYDKPTALTISPATGPTTGGSTVTITGTGFVPGQTSVTIGGILVPASAVTVTGSTKLTFNTPAHPQGLVDVTVTTPQGTTTPALPFFYNTATCILTGGNAATVTVTTSVGAAGVGVASNFSVSVSGLPAATGTPVAPGIGGIVQAQASVPVLAGTTTVSYTVSALDGSYTAVGGTVTCTDITPVQREAGIYHPLQSARLLDTRLSIPVAAGATYTLQVLGRGGVPATKVASLVTNVTVTQPAKSGFLTVYPDGNRPNTSSVNFVPGQTVANLMTAPVGADGKIRIYNGSTGTTHVLVDVSGYFSSGDTVAPGSYKRLNPSRILDTNNAIGVPTSTPVPANGYLTLKVAGVGGVQSTNVSAVALNLTVDQTQKPGFITVFKSGAVAPQISSLNFQGGQTGANLVIAPVAPDGTIRIKNASLGTVRLIADVSGYFLGGVAILDGEFVAVSPSRILDTRTTTPSVQPSVKAPVKSLGIISPKMAGRNGIPAVGVSAVIMNVTVDHPTSIGYITVYPRDPRPVASNLNFVKNQPKPNSVIGPLGSDGTVKMFNGSPGSVDLIADVSGYFISNPLR